MNFLRNILKAAFIVQLLSCLVSSGDAKLVEVTEANWERLLSTNEWMIEFFAPWCPACNRFEQVWKEFGDKAEQLDIHVGAADVNANPVLSGLFSVTSLPTVYHIKNGQYRVYNGNRDLQSLVDFIKNKEWKKIEPSSSWLTPNSVLIKMLSVLFKATLYFKDLYTYLTESFGLPIWLALAIFVVVTILLGLMLGIGLILCIDLIFPPKKYPTEGFLDNQDVITEDDDKAEKNASSPPSDETEASNATNVKRRTKAKKDY